jgi:hypothetical protein
LIVDPDAVLPMAVAFQCLKPVAGWHAQVIQSPRDLELTQLAASCPGYGLKAPDMVSARQRFRIGASERSDHAE